MQFQSTHPLGVRLISYVLGLIIGKFQSTHPLGVRHIRLAVLRLVVSFNPRTHSGCDSTSSRVVLMPLSFNPRTHSGCDSKVQTKEQIGIVSIHAPTRGATESTLSCCHGRNVSIHAPTRGATGRIINLTKLSMFQSTHPLGVRLFLLF